MTVISGCQPEMSCTLCGIPGLFHRTEDQTGEKVFRLFPLQLFQYLLDFFWLYLFFTLLYLYSGSVDQFQYRFHFFHIRSIMGPVYKRNPCLGILLGNGLIGSQHKVLNNPGGHILFIGINPHWFSIFIQLYLALREIKVYGSSFLSPLSQKSRELFHLEKHRQQLSVSFCQLLVFFSKDFFYVCVCHPFIYMDHSLRNPMRNHFSLFINIHKAAKGQTVLPGI